MKIILQHGLNGPVPWFKWLQQLCEGICDVRVPIMGTPRTPERDEWLRTMDKGFGNINQAIMIGHSLGGFAMVHYLGSMRTDQIADVVIFLAAPAYYTGKSNTEQFYNEAPDWIEAKKHAKEFLYLYSADDPLVDPAHKAIYAERLGARVIETTGMGHFAGEENELLWKTLQAYIGTSNE